MRVQIVIALLMLETGLSYAGEPPESLPLSSASSIEPPQQFPAEEVTDSIVDKDEETQLRALGITGIPLELSEPIINSPAAPALPAASHERVIWDKTPIRITLPVGQERLVHFPDNVRIGIENPQPAGLRTQSVNGTVYWLATQPFSSRRVQAQSLTTGQLILLDLQAQPGASAAPLHILLLNQTDPSTSLAISQTTPSVNFVQLTRYAAQQLYAPKRLLRELPGVFRVPVGGNQPVRLLRGGKVQALPLLSWRGGDYYVTAVRLRNLSSQAVVLDPRLLRGQWYTATFQHSRLFPVGDEADTTCVYLISSRPFTDALRGLY